MILKRLVLVAGKLSVHDVRVMGGDGDECGGLMPLRTDISDFCSANHNVLLVVYANTQSFLLHHQIINGHVVEVLLNNGE